MQAELVVILEKISVSDLRVGNERAACSPPAYSMLWANNILIKVEKIKVQDCLPEWLQLLYPYQWCGRVLVDPRAPHTGSGQPFQFRFLPASGLRLASCGGGSFSHYAMSSSLLNPGLLLGSQIPSHCTTREACPVVYMHHILY